MQLVFDFTHEISSIFLWKLLVLRVSESLLPLIQWRMERRNVQGQALNHLTP